MFRKINAQTGSRFVMLTATVALIGIAAITTSVGTGSSMASVPAGATVSHLQKPSAVRMAIATAFIRTHDAALAKASDKRIKSLIVGMAENLSRSPRSTGRQVGEHPDFLGVTKSGDTIWFNKAAVVALAVVSTAVLVGTLIYMGVEIGIAWDYAHVVFGVLFEASFGRKCAWFTYNSPRSWGTYSC